MSTDRTRARLHLDKRFEGLRALQDMPRPHKGWIRAIRDALGMSSTELAHRIGVGQSTIPHFEGSELRGTIKLETLRRVADGLDCDVVYFLLPRQNLDEAVRHQAEAKAARHLIAVAHSSRLEDQTVTEADALAQQDTLASRLIDRRGLWSDDDLTTDQSTSAAR